MTKIEIINETFNYYNEDPSRRGLGTGLSYQASPACVYKNIVTGTMCAVGRCLDLKGESPSTIEAYNSKYGGVEMMRNDLWSILADKFKPEYQGHDKYFWSQLQSFHDNRLNWNEKGATVIGKARYENLLAEFKNQ